MSEFVFLSAGLERDILPAHNINGLLFNVAQDATNESVIRDTLKTIECANPRYLGLDSGGYQFLQKELNGGRLSFDPDRPLIYNKYEINLHPEHVIEAVIRLKPDIMFGLDFPVQKIAKDRYRQEIEFRRKIGFNIGWMYETAALRKKYCPEIQLFFPIQCYDLEQFACIEPHLKCLEYDGLSLPTRNLDPAGVSLFLLKFYQMGVRKIHILSYSGFWGSALSAYFARHFFDWLSTDSTTARLCADRHVYLDPHILRTINLQDSVIFDERQRITCDCPWCEGETFTSIKNMPGTDRTALLRSHNHYVIQKTINEFAENSSALVALEKCLRARLKGSSKKLDTFIHVLSLADYLRDEDFNELKETFKNLKS